MQIYQPQASQQQLMLLPSSREGILDRLRGYLPPDIIDTIADAFEHEFSSPAFALLDSVDAAMGITNQGLAKVSRYLP
jgi:hypothetical protein